MRYRVELEEVLRFEAFVTADSLEEAKKIANSGRTMEDYRDIETISSVILSIKKE